MKAKRFTAYRNIDDERNEDGDAVEVVLAHEAEAEIAALEKERDEARAALEQEATAHRLDCQSYRTANVSLRAELEQADRELHDAEREYDNLKEGCHDVLLSLNAATKERDELKAENDELHAQRLRYIPRELYETLNAELAKAWAERDEARRQLANALLDIAQADRELHETQALLAEYTRQPPTTLDVARAELAQAKAEIERLERERDHEA